MATTKLVLNLTEEGLFASLLTGGESVTNRDKNAGQPGRRRRDMKMKMDLCREPLPEEMAQDRWMNQRFQLPCGCRGFSPRKGKWEFLPCGAPCGAIEHVGECREGVGHE